jgi:hypothetical protein
MRSAYFTVALLMHSRSLAKSTIVARECQRTPARKSAKNKGFSHFDDGLQRLGEIGETAGIQPLSRNERVATERGPDKKHSSILRTQERGVAD